VCCMHRIQRGSLCVLRAFVVKLSIRLANIVSTIMLENPPLFQHFSPHIFPANSLQICYSLVKQSLHRAEMAPELLPDWTKQGTKQGTKEGHKEGQRKNAKPISAHDHKWFSGYYRV
jgi:hypothetical protein